MPVLWHSEELCSSHSRGRPSSPMRSRLQRRRRQSEYLARANGRRSDGMHEKSWHEEWTDVELIQEAQLE